MQKEKNIDSTKASTLDKVISKLYINYIKLVAKTSSVTLEGDIDESILNNSIVGFWHGNSFIMNLLLKEINNKTSNINVVVTKDKRGNYIESIINIFGGKALRMPDGIKMKGFLRELKQKSKEDNSTLCIALDGPVGPYKEPKKIAFKLANEAEKNCLIVQCSCLRKITFHKRWDNYIIPLPFSKITFKLNDLGVISKKELLDFEGFKKNNIFL